MTHPSRSKWEILNKFLNLKKKGSYVSYAPWFKMLIFWNVGRFKNHFILIRTSLTFLNILHNFWLLGTFITSYSVNLSEGATLFMRANFHSAHKKRHLQSTKQNLYPLPLITSSILRKVFIVISVRKKSSFQTTHQTLWKIQFI